MAQDSEEVLAARYRREIDAWKRILEAGEKTIDPDREHDWEDMCYGFFLALAPNQQVAEELTVYCYDHNLL
jgi:hypothetical protein